MVRVRVLSQSITIFMPAGRKEGWNELWLQCVGRFSRLAHLESAVERRLDVAAGNEAREEEVLHGARGATEYIIGGVQRWRTCVFVCDGGSLSGQRVARNAPP